MSTTPHGGASNIDGGSAQPDLLNVLLVDDDPVQCKMLGKLLNRPGYQIRTANDGAEALRLLQENKATQLVIADWMMPEMNGLDLCQEIRKRFVDRYIYVILLTARDQISDIVEGLNAGADDYLIKPVHHAEFGARIRAAKRIIDLQEKLLAAQETLRLQATHDSLTGLWNRRVILELLSKELDRTRRGESSITLIMIDLDHFKRINDTHGHPIGDAVLKETALRLQGAVRSYDSVGRYGGEEFLILAPGYDISDSFELAERLRRLFDNTPIQLSELNLPVTLSLGVATVAKGRKLEMNAVISAADDALYRAKNSGRNRVMANAL